MTLVARLLDFMDKPAVIRTAIGIKMEYPIRHTLEGRTTLIGRDGDAEVIIPHSFISRSHAKIEELNPGEYAITDLGSKNGTYLKKGQEQAQRLERMKPYPLQDKATIFLGNPEDHYYKLQFQLAQEQK